MKRALILETAMPNQFSLRLSFSARQFRRTLIFRLPEPLVLADD